jgi:hypothetical protein
MTVIYSGLFDNLQHEVSSLVLDCLTGVFVGISQCLTAYPSNAQVIVMIAMAIER